MPAVLTQYRTYMRPALAGMIADQFEAQMLSRIVQTAGGIPFGAVACQGTNDNQIIVAAANKLYIGVTVIAPELVPLLASATANQYNLDDVAAVMVRGGVWVTVNVNVAAGQPAGFDPANGNFQLASTTNATAIAGGRWETTATAGSLALLRLL